VANGNPHPECVGGALMPGSCLRIVGDCVSLHLLPRKSSYPIHRSPPGESDAGGVATSMGWSRERGKHLLTQVTETGVPKTRASAANGAWLHVWGYLTLLLDLSSNCEVAWTGKPK
jgi:hypothetical protein